jgi:hypothetical protein
MTIKARLVRESPSEHTNEYHLLLHDENGMEQRIDIARIDFGGMTLVNYEVSRHGEQQILSAFFYINIMGHDLDQWLHFDLGTGARIEDYINPMQVANRKPEKDRIETEEDRKFVADKLKIIVNRWGEEKK